MAALPLLMPGAAGALGVPPGYQVDSPIEDVGRPTALAFAPEGGDVFVAERNGRVQVFNGVDDPKPDLVLDIADNVHAFGDRGLLGMTLDPDYPAEPYIYLSYTYDAPPGESAPVHEQRPDGSDNCVRRLSGVHEADGECIASGRVSRFELDPEGFAGGEALGPEDEQMLVADWCQQYQSHSMGDLEFDDEGALLASGGEAANFAALDYGQFGNPCGDPDKEGGALRSQDLRGRWNDPTGYNGTVIRIDPETGAPWPTNQQIGSGDSQARRIVGFGLRNPFRIAIRRGTDELYVADVGSSFYDEINLIPAPTSQPNGWPSNFGWPCLEGDGPHPGFHALAFAVPLLICQSLYEAAPVNLRSPHFAYPRSGELFEADNCDPNSGAALSGLTFYEGQGPASSQGPLPESLDGALLIADAARGCVWAMGAGIGGRPSAGELQNLITRLPQDEGAFTPVNFAVDPGGALYVPDFWGNRIVRLRHFEGNGPPVARIGASRTFGLMDGEGKFDVEFDGEQSTDADGEPLTYEWDLDEDGEFEVGPTGDPTLQHVYEAEENFIAQLRVTDEEEATDVDRITLYPGDRPPKAVTMGSPLEGVRWTVGDKIPLSGSADDPDEGDEVRLDWDVLVRHCPDHCHSHSLAHVSGPEPDPVTAPDHEYPSHLLVVLTATDERGMSAEPIAREIHPLTVDVRLESVPSGVPLTIASTTQSAPFAERLLAGGNATVSAPETAAADGRQYAFVSWSDGGARTHLVNRTESSTLVARYAPIPLAGPPVGVGDSPPRLVKLRFASRPPGLPLRVGRPWRRSAFDRWLEWGHRSRIEAPRRLRRRGRIHVFSHWSDGGRRVHRVKATRSRLYVAVFRSQPVRKGVRQSLRWQRLAK